MMPALIILVSLALIASIICFGWAEGIWATLCMCGVMAFVWWAFTLVMA